MALKIYTKQERSFNLTSLVKGNAKVKLQKKN